MRLKAFAASVFLSILSTPAFMSSAWAADGLVVHHELSMEMAEKIARGAIDACRGLGFHTTITVIDSGGLMKAFLRDEDTGPHTIDLSGAKAYTALTLASRFKTSLDFATQRNSTLGSPMTNIKGVVGIGGGVPIKFHDEVIGAVGSSGAVGGDKDEVCANAGIAKVADQLK